MKKIVLMFCGLAIITAPAVNFATVQEKTADTMEYRMPDTSRSDSTTGTLDGSATYDRVWGVNYDGTCNASSSDSASNGSSYLSFAIHTTADENLDAVVSASSGGLDDTVMFVYCDPFDPANPSANVVAWDDDGGTGYLSAISPADGVAITADTTYYLVIAGYSSSQLGDFTLDLGGTAVFGVAQQPTPTPVPTATPAGPSPIPTAGQRGLAVMMVLLVIGAVVILRRRMA